MESPKVASAAGGDASRRPAHSTKAMPAARGSCAHQEAPGGRCTLGDGCPVSIARRSLSSSGAQLGQLSPARTWGRVVRRELGQGGQGGGAGSIPWRVLGWAGSQA